MSSPMDAAEWAEGVDKKLEAIAVFVATLQTVLERNSVFTQAQWDAAARDARAAVEFVKENGCTPSPS